MSTSWDDSSSGSHDFVILPVVPVIPEVFDVILNHGGPLANGYLVDRIKDKCYNRLDTIGQQETSCLLNQ